MPNLQVLERHPIRRAKPGQIEHQEFEYIRHGTVNVVLLLVVHTGRMEAFCLDSKSAHNYTRLLQSFRQRHRHLQGIFLVQDNDPTHIAQRTTDYFAASEGWWRPRFTPTHASWLNQAELLNEVFGSHYLKRRSFKSRREYIDHVNVLWPEYNRLYAHPFEWAWTNQKMRSGMCNGDLSRPQMTFLSQTASPQGIFWQDTRLITPAAAVLDESLGAT